MDNPLFNAFGSFDNFIKSFWQFKQNVQQNGINPQQQMDNAKTDYERKMIEDEIRHIYMGSNR